MRISCYLCFRLKKMLAEKDMELGIKTELLKKKIEQWKSANR